MISVENEKIQFATNISHDLRNLLTGIKLTAEDLAQPLYDHTSKQFIQKITNNKLMLAFEGARPRTSHTYESIRKSSNSLLTPNIWPQV